MLSQGMERIISLSGGGVGDAKELWVRGYQGSILTLLLMY